MNKFSEIEQAVLAALVYFDIFDFPLTLLEIWRYLYAPRQGDNLISGLGELQFILENLKIKNIIETQEGFFYLKGREETINKRKERYLRSESKFKKAIKFAKVFRYFPGVKMIAICNSLSWSNSLNNSDIDLFIITEKGKIWSARFFCVLFTQFLKSRPTPGRSRDTICLSFFISEEKLNLKEAALPAPPYGDIYFIYWIVGLVPLYNDGVFKKFVKENSWIKKYLPRSFAYDTNPRRVVKTASRFLKKIINILLANKFCGRFYKKYQLKVMPKRLRQLAAVDDTRVIINDRILKFHDKDRRREFCDTFQEKFHSIIYG